MYQYVDIKPIDLVSGKISIKNLHDFVSLSGYELCWKLNCDGRITAQGKLPLRAIQPHTSGSIQLKYDLPKGCRFGCYLDFTVHTPSDTLWAPAGYECAMVQLQVDIPVVSSKSVQTHSLPLATHRDGEYLLIEGEDFTYCFNTYRGFFESLTKDGVEFLDAPMGLGAWRAPTDNDRSIKKIWTSQPGGEIYGAFELAHLNTDVYETRLKKGNGDSVVIQVELRLAAPARVPLLKGTVTYTVWPRGQIDIAFSADVHPDSPHLPRLGFELSMPSGNENVDYFGMGPGENYVDMHNSARMGLFHTSVTEQYVPYIRPQEHGNHTFVRWAMVSDVLGRGLLIEGEPAFEFKASHFTATDLEHAQNCAELEPRPQTFLRIDYKVGGIGSNSCGPSLNPDYQFSDKHIEFTFHLQPVFLDGISPAELF